MGIAISLIVTIMEILNGFLNTDKEKIKMAQTFNGSKLQATYKNNNTSKYNNIYKFIKN